MHVDNALSRDQRALGPWKAMLTDKTFRRLPCVLDWDETLGSYVPLPEIPKTIGANSIYVSSIFKDQMGNGFFYFMLRLWAKTMVELKDHFTFYIFTASRSEMVPFITAMVQKLLDEEKAQVRPYI